MLSDIYTMLTQLPAQGEHGERYFDLEVEINIFQSVFLLGACPTPNDEVMVLDSGHNWHKLEENANDAQIIEALYQYLLKVVPSEREVAV